MAKRVSSIYGDALFDLALEEDRMDDLAEEISAVKKVFLQNEELFKLLNHPEVHKSEKLAFVENAFQGEISEEVLGFLHVIIKKDRYNEIIPVCDRFLQRVKRHRGIGEATVTSAVTLSEDQKSAVEKRLLEVSRYQSLEIDYKVEPSILGGLIIRMDDRVVDSSLKTQIDTLSRQLSQIQLS